MQAATEIVPGPESGEPLQTAYCPICGSDRLHYAFSIRQARVLQCADCKFTARTDANSTPACGSGAAAVARLASDPATLRGLLAQILRPEERDAPVQIADWNLRGDVSLVAGADSATSTKPAVTLSAGQLDAFVDPLPALRQLREKLAPDQPVVFTFSDIHQSARAGSPNWERQAAERTAYVDTPSALTILYRAGFRCLGVRRLRRRVSLEHWVTKAGRRRINRSRIRL